MVNYTACLIVGDRSRTSRCKTNVNAIPRNFWVLFFKEMIGLFEVEFNYFLEIECRDESMIQLRDAFVEELVYGCLGNK